MSSGSHPRRYLNPRMAWIFGDVRHPQQFHEMLAAICLSILRAMNAQVVPLSPEAGAFLRDVIRAAQGNARRRANIRNTTAGPDLREVTVETLAQWEAAARWTDDPQGAFDSEAERQNILALAKAKDDAQAALTYFFRMAAEFPIRRVKGAHGDDVLAGLSRHIRAGGPRKPAPKGASSAGRPRADRAAIYAAADQFTGNPRHQAAELARRFHKSPAQIRKILAARNAP